MESAVTALSVNVNKIAWLRNSREGARPSVLDAARHGHRRRRARHHRPPAARSAPHPSRRTSRRWPSCWPPKRRGSSSTSRATRPPARATTAIPGFDRLIETARPAQATLVPDAEAQLTSDHGWDLSDPAAARFVRDVAARHRGRGVRVSLFMDPVEEQIARAKECGADRVELYTGPYAELVERHGVDHPETRAGLDSYARAARYAGGSWGWGPTRATT